VLVGMFQRGWAETPAQYAWQYRTIAVLATLGVVLAAWYMLWMVERVFFGPLREPPGQPDEHAEAVRDLNLREILALAPLAVAIVWIGLWPQFFLARIAPTVDPYLRRYESIIHAVPDRQQATHHGQRKSHEQLDVSDRLESTGVGASGQACAGKRPPAISPQLQQTD
jgi:formate hydrogenlyase subunit 3/multisubunit Na+/H+ antiporter MnhD subunit